MALLKPAAGQKRQEDERDGHDDADDKPDEMNELFAFHIEKLLYC